MKISTMTNYALWDTAIIFSRRGVVVASIDVTKIAFTEQAARGLSIMKGMDGSVGTGNLFGWFSANYNPTPKGYTLLFTGFSGVTDKINGSKIDGGWSNWTYVGICNPGNNQQMRVRTCNNPTPVNGGNDCIGDSSQLTPCPTAQDPFPDPIPVTIYTGTGNPSTGSSNQSIPSAPYTPTFPTVTPRIGTTGINSTPTPSSTPIPSSTPSTVNYAVYLLIFLIFIVLCFIVVDDDFITSLTDIFD